jgi:hypothetical protein
MARHQSNNQAREARMNPGRSQMIERIYRQALEQESGRREAFLAEACKGDTDLLREVQSLLARNATTMPENPSVQQLNEPG